MRAASSVNWISAFLVDEAVVWSMWSYSSCFLEFDLEHKSLFSVTLLSSDNFSLNIFVQKLYQSWCHWNIFFWLIVVVGNSQALVSTCTFYLEMVAQIFGHFETAFYMTNLKIMLVFLGGFFCLLSQLWMTH